MSSALAESGLLGPRLVQPASARRPAGVIRRRVTCIGVLPANMRSLDAVRAGMDEIARRGLDR